MLTFCLNFFTHGSHYDRQRLSHMILELLNLGIPSRDIILDRLSNESYHNDKIKISVNQYLYPSNGVPSCNSRMITKWTNIGRHSYALFATQLHRALLSPLPSTCLSSIPVHLSACIRAIPPGKCLREIRYWGIYENESRISTFLWNSTKISGTLREVLTRFIVACEINSPWKHCCVTLNVFIFLIMK